MRSRSEMSQSCSTQRPGRAPNTARMSVTYGISLRAPSSRRFTKSRPRWLSAVQLLRHPRQHAFLNPPREMVPVVALKDLQRVRHACFRQRLRQFARAEGNMREVLLGAVLDEDRA